MNNFKHQFWAIVPAAGAGTRMKLDIPKQYLQLSDKTIFETTLNVLFQFDAFKKIIVAVAKDDATWETQRVGDKAIGQQERVDVIVGGKERYHSVFNALNAIKSLNADNDDWVLVHDVARPCLTLGDIERLTKTLADHPVGGLLGTRVRDTMKKTSSRNIVDHTVDRDHLWHALTPQMFRLGVLFDALSHALNNGCDITDEASAIEQMNLKPVMVEGSSMNIKVTQKEDLLLAKLILAAC